MSETAEKLINWTGERCVPWGHEVQGIYEHLNRYYFAAGLAAGKHVLDLASGEGYGSAILAARASSVIGLDIDPTSVEHSRSAYPLPNAEFVEGTMLDLSRFEDGEFDLVVCFEALEHVAEHAELLGEITRVLGPGGAAVISTPDREAYAATLSEPNPFHVKELDRNELEDLLRAHFEHFALWGQNSVAGSRLFRLDAPTEGSPAETLVAHRGGAWAEEGAVPIFFVAVASKRKLPELPSASYLLDPKLEVLREREVLRDRIAELEQRLADYVALEEATRARAALLDERISDLTDELTTMTTTRGWRVLQRYRRFRGATSRLRRS